MAEYELNPMAEKAVLILEGPDGTPVILQVYKPRFRREYEEYRSDFIMGSTAENSIVFDVGEARPITGPENVGAVFADAQLAWDEPIPVQATSSDIQEWIAKRQEYALNVVYLAGVKAGAEAVKFRDDYVERALRNNALQEAVEAVRVETLNYGAKSKKRKGLSLAQAIITRLKK